MKTINLFTSVNAALLVTALSCGVNVRAVTTPAVQTLDGVNPSQRQIIVVDFNNTEEAKMLHRAYVILATGDHDYAGHRVEAMHHVEQAAKYLGVDLSGDLKGHEKQALSDDNMRTAARLLNKTLARAEVKDEPRIFEQIKSAIREIHLALTTK